MSELKKLEEQLKDLQIAKIRNTDVGHGYFKQMRKEVRLLKRIKELTPTKAIKAAPEATLWSEKEVRQLRNVYADQTAEEIATALGRTVDAVRSKVKLLGLKKK